MLTYCLKCKRCRECRWKQKNGRTLLPKYAVYGRKNQDL